MQTIYDLMNKEVIVLLAIDGDDCLTVECCETRVMTALAVPRLIQIENVFLRRTFLVLGA